MDEQLNDCGFPLTARQIARRKQLCEILSSASTLQLIAFKSCIWENYCNGWNYYDQKNATAAIDAKRFNAPSIQAIILDADVLYVTTNFK